MGTQTSIIVSTVDAADTLVLGRATSERMDVTARGSRRHRTLRARRTR